MISLPAINVDDAYTQCDPGFALPADDERYVDLSKVRGEHGKIINTIQRSIRRSIDSNCTYLVSGHRGSGKTTELFRLQKKLKDDGYFCVYFDVGNALDLADISYIDIFLAMIDEVSQALEEQRIGINLDKSIIESIYGWVQQEIYTEKATQKNVDGVIKAGVEASVGIPSLVKLFGGLTGDIKHSQSQRDVIREKIEKKASDFISKVNQFLIAVRNAVKQQGYKDIVVVADGLEKIHYRTFTLNSNKADSHTELFVRHAEQLLALQCHIIYTVPIGLVFNINLNSDYENVYVMPMVKLDEDGNKALKTLIEKRVNIQSVFTDTTLVDTIIANSGGVVRDLMRLIRLACDTDDEKISAIEVQYAISKLTKEYDRLLKRSDIPILELVNRIEQINPSDERSTQLLQDRIILEYENGKRSAKLHPICLQIEWVTNEIAKLTAINTSNTGNSGNNNGA